jgi:predicted nucleic acid-binding protein
MIFVDTNVVMYAVGRPHPLRDQARAFFEGAMSGERDGLITDAEVLQELLHAYIPVDRWKTLDAALTLVDSCIPRVLPIEEQDVRSARLFADSFPQLGARDLLHLAVCRRHSVTEVMTFDRALAAVFAP